MKKIKKLRGRILLTMIATLSVLAFNACYVDYGMTVEDYDVITTLYDPEYDFTKDATYSMPDTIIHITKEGDDTKISREYDSFILEQVNSQMQLRGFRKITDPSQELPDVAIILRAVSSTTYQAYSSYYWGGYWGGWYYPWYGGTTVYSYTTGSLLIDMLDVDNINIQEELYPTAWIAGINGLLGDTGSGTRNRLSTSIGQAFVQSPYIGNSAQ